MIRILTFSTLFPSSVRPGHGIFVETRLRELVASGQIETRVVAPVPWFFSTNPRFGQYARIASTPRREMRNGLEVLHPRYLLPPGVGMSMAPFALAVGARATVRRLLDQGYDFDVIDAHYYYPDGVAAALLARHFRKPFTVTARGSDINLIANHAVPRKLMRWAANRAAASIGVSRALTNVMASLGMPQSKLIVMPNGVDLMRFRLRDKAAARAELSWPAGPTLLSAGNLVENKGHHLAIEALAGLPEFRLVIAGEGPERNALADLAARLQVAQRVQFAGRVDQERLAVCYGAADILVLASSREGWPNVLLEAMACGTPVVATNVGGIPEIVTTAEAGRILSDRSASAVVQAVTELWREMPEPAAVHARAAGCSWDSTSRAQLRLFGQIATRPMEPVHA